MSEKPGKSSGKMQWLRSLFAVIFVVAAALFLPWTQEEEPSDFGGSGIEWNEEVSNPAQKPKEDLSDSSSDVEQEIQINTPSASKEETEDKNNGAEETESKEVTTDFAIMEITLEDIPEYTDEPYCVVNDNIPFFVVESDFTDSFEIYTDLDELGRCGVVYANIGRDLMPTEERGNISSVKPTGWVTAKYDFVQGKYLYNRCHLIGFQLTGENANKKNLITGTRYMNVDGMLPFENMVADYIKETENHVMYRVYPMFDEEDLVAKGVLMEAWSVEDDGEGVCYNVFVYNIQPGVMIDYATGESRAAD